MFNKIQTKPNAINDRTQENKKTIDPYTTDSYSEMIKWYPKDKIHKDF
jgi:hypothetical protein